MSEELRIRDTHPGPLGARGTHGDQPQRGGARAPADEPGETAWDLAEPLFSPPPQPRGESGTQEAADAPLPFPLFPGMGAEEVEAPKTPRLDIRRLIWGVIKRLWLAAGIAVSIAALFVVAAVTLVKPKWEAAATVMVHTRQDEFSLGSAKPFESQDYNLKTMLDTIKLPSALAELSKSLKQEATPRTLSAAIGVNMGKESNLFQITAVWTHPVFAADIANTVARQLIQRSRDLRHKDAEKAYADYMAQLESARGDLAEITDRMRAFKAEHKVSDFGAETQVLLDSLSRLETELNTKTAETEAMREAVADVEQAIKGEPEMVVTSTVYRNPLKTRLTDYEWQLQEARSRYTEENPKVIKLQKRVDVLKQMIDETKDEGAPENLYSANAKLVELQQRQRELGNDVRIHDAQISALSRTILQNRAKLAALNEAEKDYQLLQQRLASAENLESTLAGRVEEAKVVVLRNQAAFELLEPATPPTERAPSPKKLIAIAGVFLGGMAGLFVALLLELLDPVVRTRRDALGIPGVELAWEFQQVPEGHYTLIDAAEPGEPVAVLFRRLINDLDAKLKPEDWTCLGVASVEAQAGRTLVATNLAQVLAMKEYQVILVDADLRPVAGTRPAELFGIPASAQGLLQALYGEVPIAAVLNTTETPGLSLIDSGTTPPEQTEAAPKTAEPRLASRPRDHELAQLGSRQFRSVLDTLTQSGRNLLFDLPPIDTHETVSEAAAGLANVILVARSGQTTRAGLRETVQRLEDRGAKVRGILVNDVPTGALEGTPLFPARRKRRAWWRPSRRRACVRRGAPATAPGLDA